MPTQHIAKLLGITCWVCLHWPPCRDLLWHVDGCCWLKFENGQIWTNNTHHVATHHNTVANANVHNMRYVAWACCDRFAGVCSGFVVSHDCHISYSNCCCYVNEFVLSEGDINKHLKNLRCYFRSLINTTRACRRGHFLKFSKSRSHSYEHLNE